MSNFDHIIYKNNPVQFKTYVNKRCKVTTTDKSCFIGVVYTVDPVSESVVLWEDTDADEPRLKIISGKAVEKIDIISEERVEAPKHFEQRILQLSENFLTQRKKAVISFLTENRIPVKDNDGVLEIQDIVSIHPPYHLDNCVSTNSIVLSRIRSILSRLQ